MKTTTKLIFLAPAIVSLIACGGSGETDESPNTVAPPTTPTTPTSPTTPVTPPSLEQQVETAISQIVSPQASIISCSNVANFCNTGTGFDINCINAITACDTNKAAYIESVYSSLSTLVDISLEDFTAAIEYSFDYANGLGNSFSDMEIAYISPDTNLGQPIDISQVSIPRSDQLEAGVITPMLSDNAGIPADEEYPAQAPSGETGWYYRNSENGKINWYIYSDFGEYGTSYTIADLQSLTATVKHYTDTGYYFFNVYTQTQGAGDASSWYRSRLNLVANTDSVVPDQTFLGHFERTPTEHDTTNHLPISLGSNNRFSTGATTIDDINTEQILLISFSTASLHPEGWADFLLKEIQLELAGEIFTYIPVAFPDPAYSDDNLNQILGTATSAYMEISSGTELFDGLALNILEENGSWKITLSDGAQPTHAIDVLMAKLNEGGGKNALAPAVNFVAETTTLQIDVGAALTLADIANLTATIYTDNTKTTELGTINIGDNGISTTVN